MTDNEKAVIEAAKRVVAQIPPYLIEGLPGHLTISVELGPLYALRAALTAGTEPEKPLPTAPQEGD